jgi:hypothetical protein
MMSDIRLDLIYASMRGVAPPQDWTHRAVEEIERLRADLESLRKDAARYRWLRGRAYKDGATLAIDVAVIDDIAIGDFGEFIDYTADAAMAKDAP